MGAGFLIVALMAGLCLLKLNRKVEPFALASVGTLLLWLCMLSMIGIQGDGIEWLALLVLSSYGLLRRGNANAIILVVTVILAWLMILQEGLADIASYVLVPLMTGLFANLLVRRVAALDRMLERSVTTDPVTGFGNIELLRIEMEKAIEMKRRYQIQSAAVMLVFNNHAECVSKHGDSKTNDLLRELAQVWSSRLRNTDILCRYADNSFVCLLVNTGVENAVYLAEDLVRASEAYDYQGQVDIEVKYRIIPCELTENEDDWHRAFRSAEEKKAH